RLPFGLEVVGFAEEEGQRYKATFLGSGALTGHFDAAWLDQTDADGVTMREAMRAAGLPAAMEAIAALTRDPARYLGFVEVHIEQGPVLNELDLPLGVVTSINGSVRYLGEVVGMELDRICQARGLAHRVEETLRAAAAPSDTAWQRRWENAVAALGLPAHRMPSGAGHDAMKLHEVMPQAMLFVRGLNSGISHNPLESSTSDDIELAVRAFRHLLDQLGTCAS
ncbi:MAG: M20/M25/M40 family metallo-hydrolase, partial [Burkholderiaceae bacterium]|nr:M20/M25/M40 family metallo-hydrolase [Burkholderiaceae bacterium]